MFARLLTLAILVQSALCGTSFLGSSTIETIAVPTLGSWNHLLTPALPWALNTTTAIGATGIQNNSVKPTATVIVGGAGLKFSPASLNASIGSIVAFDFLSRNHTLSQSTLHNPCQRNGSIDTGFNQFNPTNVSGKFIVELEVTNEDPQWFLCAQDFNVSHCHAGMVFSLNPHGKHKEFLQNAISSVPDHTTTPIHACQLPSPVFITGSGPASATETGLQSTANSSSVITPAISNLGTRSVRLRFGLGAMTFLLLLG